MNDRSTGAILGGLTFPPHQGLGAGGGLRRVKGAAGRAADLPAAHEVADLAEGEWRKRRRVVPTCQRRGNCVVE
jgi:hypothetical protein